MESQKKGKRDKKLFQINNEQNISKFDENHIITHRFKNFYKDKHKVNHRKKQKLLKIRDKILKVVRGLEFDTNKLECNHFNTIECITAEHKFKYT